MATAANQNPVFTARASDDQPGRVHILREETDAVTGAARDVSVFTNVTVGWLEGERVKALAEIETAEARVREQATRVAMFDTMLHAARAANLASAAPSAVASLRSPTEGKS